MATTRKASPAPRARTAPEPNPNRPRRSGPAAPFAALPDEDRCLLLSKCTKKRIPKGRALFAQGERHSANYVIENGLVRTYHTSATGKEITLAYWSDGDLIGGPNFLSAETAHVWSARAVEDTVVWCVRADEFEELVYTHPAIARFVIDSLTFKVFWLSALLQAFGTQSVFFRLAHLLLKLAEMYGVPTKNGIEIPHHFTQEDLANMVGATRQWVSTTLRYFQRDKIVCSTKRHLLIQNIELLRRIVGDAGPSGKQIRE